MGSRKIKKSSHKKKVRCRWRQPLPSALLASQIREQARLETLRRLSVKKKPEQQDKQESDES